MISSNTPITFNRTGLTDEQLIYLYTEMKKPRLIEEKMLLLLRQGKVSKWFSGIGQEAIAIGAVNALEKEEYILPMHRNLGVFTGRNVPLNKLFKQLQGKKGGFSKARERSFHFGTNDYHIWGMISHLGPQLSIADGIALGYKLKKEQKTTIVFTGEGGTSEGEFHEALNVAAVWKLPVIFLIENNGYGLSTPVSEQFACEQLADRAKGYGMRGLTIDGNNVLEVYTTLSKLADEIRQNPEPVLVECMTFRRRGHEEASGTKYVPKELMVEWEQKDPVERYEEFLLAQNVISQSFMDDFKANYLKEINAGLEEAFSELELQPDTQEEERDVYFPYTQKITTPSSATTQKRFVDAISDGLREAMRQHTNLIVMGQDIADYGGVFKITEGFMEEFGKERVRNTPLCESAIIGAGLGLTVEGFKSVVEMQFADFVSVGFNQIVNNLAKIHYRWGQNADVVVRMPCGGGVGAGPFHSQSNEAWFFHTPGLKIFYPSNPIDAKGLLIAAIEDPNPVMFFEHKALYRKITAEVPDGYYTVEAGKAALAAEGEDISIITYGMGVHWALQALKDNPDISADIVDLRTLLPFDKEAIATSIKKTGKAIILHEDTLTGGMGGEIAAYLSEELFEYLDAPVIRSAALDTPVPFSPALEENFMPAKRFQQQLRKLVAY